MLTVGTNPAGEQFLSVRDDGPGIPESEIPCVLSAFGQGKLAQTIAEGGAGLGLPIVQGLVKLHGGKFDFRTSVGQGTEIIITFPKPRVMQPQPRAIGQEEPAAAPDTAPQAAALRQICEGTAMAGEMMPSKSAR